MAQWSVAVARKHLSEIIAKTSEGPQVITNRGRIVAIVNRPGDALLVISEETGANLISRIEQLKKQAGHGAELKLPPRKKEKLVNPFGGT